MDDIISARNKLIRAIEYNKAKTQFYESKTELSSKQIKAIVDRNEFLEDCIAEMAVVVYS